MRKSRTYLLLTGGLGNQLFQLAAALEIGSEELYVEVKSGNPRSTNGTPDVFLFDLSETAPKIINFNNGGRRKNLARIYGFLIRSHLNQDRGKIYGSFRWIGKTFANVILISIYKKLFLLYVPKDIGYEDSPKSNRKFLVGYFQSYKFAESSIVARQLQKLKPIAMSARLQNLIELAKKEAPIFVHLRLSDYRSHSHFGIPSLSYYRDAITMLNTDEKRRIWIFSDEIHAAESFSKNFINSYVVNDDNLSPAEILELFKYGGDYVIANSTFSWWGAQLRKDSTARVLAPTPWFKENVEPTEIIPPNWIRIKAF